MFAVSSPKAIDIGDLESPLAELNAQENERFQEKRGLPMSPQRRSQLTLLFIVSLALHGCGDTRNNTGGGPDVDEDSTDQPLEGDCEDELDNDGDGLTDCADEDCADSPECVSGAISNFTAQVAAFPVEGSDGMTIEAWVYLDEPTYYGHALRTWGAPSCPNQSFTLSSPTPEDGAWLHGDPSAPFALQALTAGSWIHLAAVQTAEVSTLYVNGEEAGSASPLSEGSYNCEGATVSADAVVWYGSWRLSTGSLYTDDFTPLESLTANNSTLALYTFDDRADPGYDASDNGRQLAFSSDPTIGARP